MYKIYIIFIIIMSEVILNTGWKYWDRYLDKLVGKKINCLDIGAFTGASSCWMLNNLCTHPYSRVFSVDIWDYTDDYGSDDNAHIEKKFDDSIQHTGKQDQNIKMKIKSEEAILRFKQFDYIIFDLIFISGSFEAKDIMKDAILGWDILDEGGIMIFDNFRWEELEDEYYKPRIAIETFITMYTPQLKKLHTKYQYFVQKINQRNHNNNQIDNEYFKLLDEINYFNFYKFKYTIDDIIKEDIEYKLIMSDTKPDIIKKVPRINKDIKNKLLFDTIYNLSNSNIINHIINRDFKLSSINIFLQEIKLSKEKLLNITLIGNNFNYNYDNVFIHCHSKYNKHYTQIIKGTNIEFSNMEITSYEKFQELTKLKNFNTIIFKGAIDEKIHYYIFIYCCIALNIQNKGGSFLLYVPYYVSYNLITECVYLLKKYYKSITIQNPVALGVDTTYCIRCDNFLTIKNEEKDTINKIVSNIYTNIKNKNTYIISVININLSINKYNIIIKNITDTMYTNTHKIFNIYNNVLTKYNNVEFQLIIIKKIITNLIEALY